MIKCPQLYHLEFCTELGQKAWTVKDAVWKAHFTCVEISLYSSLDSTWPPQTLSEATVEFTISTVSVSSLHAARNKTRILLTQQCVVSDCNRRNCHTGSPAVSGKENFPFILFITCCVCKVEANMLLFTQLKFYLLVVFSGTFNKTLFC